MHYLGVRLQMIEVEGIQVFILTWGSYKDKLMVYDNESSTKCHVWQMMPRLLLELSL